MKPILRSIVPVVLAIGTATVVLAYNIDGKRWQGGQVVFHVGMDGLSPSGISWSNAFESAMATWNSETSFQFLIVNEYIDPCTGYRANSNGSGLPAGFGDNRNSTDFRGSLCGNDFGTGTVAVTLTFEQPGTLGFANLVETDIIFNSSYDWDIYDGPSGPTIDFMRVALHELGHAMGLGHEPFNQAIMAPFVGSINSLQADDIAGAEAIYATASECLVLDLEISAAVLGNLGAGDCRIMDLFGGSNDFSLVDTYRLVLAEPTYLEIALSSMQLDPVLILTNANLGDIQIFDDVPGSCDARITATLPAGDYRLLVNTYDQPVKCGGNTGDYNLTVSNTTMPVLGAIRNASGAPLLAEALITGAAAANGSEFFRSSFSAQELIDVNARITPDPEHIGLPASLYVLVTLSDGRQFTKNSAGEFVRFTGDLSTMHALRTGTLEALEEIVIANNLHGANAGIAGQNVAVHVGYAMTSSPNNIFYGSTPIRFDIGF